jgi:hypothetical protein
MIYAIQMIALSAPFWVMNLKNSELGESVPRMIEKVNKYAVQNA